MSSRNWNQSTAALKIRLQQALDAGRPLWARPWIAPTAWTSGQTIQVGEVRKNSATPAQWYIAAAQGGVCGAIEPTQTNGSAVWDGTANTSVLWTHLGSSADWDNVDDPAAPTLTATGSTSVPAGYVSFNPWANRQLLTVRGAYLTQHVGSGTGIVLNTFDSKSGTTVYGGSGIAFMSDATGISFQVPASVQGIRVYVDGRPVTMSNIGPNQGGWYYHTIAFGKRKERLWEVFFGKDTAAIYNVAIPSNAQIWPAPSVVPLVGAFIGDSYLQGSGYGPFLDGNTLSGHVGRLIGIDNMWRFGTGGTGLLNPGSGPFYTYRERLPQVLAQSPNVILVQGSTNDASYTQAQVNTEALALLDAIRAATTAPVFWFGPAPLSGGYSSIQIVDTAIAMAIAARPNSNIFYKSLVTSVPPVFIGSHNNTNFSAFSTIGEYIGGDNVHPVDKGTMYLARRMASAYANEMLPLVA
ncbi:GDSL-type esterase/lipase family protein [Xanthobacter sp. 91]|uniref:SGNH/GDSL hydrolase family protein n=1 Tax=Xanthobacter sp. 91 TaxID=1117244 RepID=UPI00049861A5|nr:GDSL-type esterase/lipase family protein [Xanthobacter sp. 91]